MPLQQILAAQQDLVVVHPEVHAAPLELSVMQTISAISAALLKTQIAHLEDGISSLSFGIS
ncbi:hypothetical protein NEOLI_000360 [Neolecta irregularis DAH-3]|uniref:Uncharacterized protein n=1 Tax=Neolecta irregularis (strain DAH-3) TaxID=1198029 RepID=A0A1U7LN73_NEOID|nr:hypothetical protein NEOLI_000360 [Neolecta irregularis DAH-3]|eukprot:OLL24116.1 hypothetical protein NEOLI_000360 [Neolecta irregularis DAH-3]